jgi:alkanesulfonate monooxygenase SsuD/methylene tetrahydromethanopterin reductase-like flavin-dependent oxidoreductase (luciferase family)
VSTAQRNAEEAIDQLEKHVGWMMPEDEEYLIEVEPETSLDDYELGDSFKVDYRLETTIPSDTGPDSEYEFKGSHLIHGEPDEVREEYEALIDEFEDRFQVSDLEYPEWEVIQ